MTTSQLLDILFNSLIVLAIIIVIACMWFVAWNMIRYPIRMKDTILKEREEARKDLQQIQAAKSVEWDKFKELEDELDRTRKAYFSLKDKQEQTRAEIAKATEEKQKLLASIKELREQQKKDPETT